MKIFILMLLALNLSAQPPKEKSYTTDRMWVGTSFSLQDNQFLSVMGESDIGIAFLRSEVRYDFCRDLRIHLKMGFRIVKYKDFAFYLSLPPMYYKWGEGYTTPFNAEISWKRLVLLNVDFYKDTPVPSLQVRLPLKFRKKK